MIWLLIFGCLNILWGLGVLIHGFLNNTLLFGLLAGLVTLVVGLMCLNSYFKLKGKQDAN